MTTHQSNFSIFGPVSPEIMRRHFTSGHLIRAVLAILYHNLHSFYIVFWVTRGLRSRCFTELHRKRDAGRQAGTYARTHAEIRKRVDIYKSASVAFARAR